MDWSKYRQSPDHIQRVTRCPKGHLVEGCRDWCPACFEEWQRATFPVSVEPPEPKGDK